MWCRLLCACLPTTLLADSCLSLPKRFLSDTNFHHHKFIWFHFDSIFRKMFQSHSILFFFLLLFVIRWKKNWMNDECERWMNLANVKLHIRMKYKHLKHNYILNRLVLVAHTANNKRHKNSSFMQNFCQSNWTIGVGPTRLETIEKINCNDKQIDRRICSFFSLFSLDFLSCMYPHEPMWNWIRTQCALYVATAFEWLRAMIA